MLVKVKATQGIYQAGETEGMHLIVTATLDSSFPITLHNQGQWNSTYGTILCSDFRLKLFEWYDVTAEEKFQAPENDEDSEWGCEPGVFKDACLELQPGDTLVVKTLLEDMNPLCDPLIYAVRRNDHTFRLKAKPQKLKWTRKTKNELFADGKDEVPQEDYKTWDELEVASEDVVEFIVKAE